jgi:hypothetical protein
MQGVEEWRSKGAACYFSGGNPNLWYARGQGDAAVSQRLNKSQNVIISADLKTVPQ